MSVLCGRVPNVALALAARHEPELLQKAVAVMGGDDDICDLSAPAYQSGVRVGMNARQAKMRCADVTILEAKLDECHDVQDEFLAELRQWELPTEAHGLGMAYVDLQGIVINKKDAMGLVSDLGRRVRERLGGDLQPSLGWDHSKFCSRAAAYHTQPGRMKLVSKEDEVSFLAPLPISYLPLPAYHLQRLRWLGITTLGQFAALKAGAVLQQFGKPGQLAQRWAQGRDNRPVRNMLDAGWSPLEIEFETPTELLPLVMDSLMAKLQPCLEAWAEELRGCNRLRFELFFVNGERRVLDLNWIAPVAQAMRLRPHITNQFAALNWPTALDRLVVVQAATAELHAMQLSLFEEPIVECATLEEIVEPLKRRYGAIFLRGAVVDEAHPVDERRVQKLVI